MSRSQRALLGLLVVLVVAIGGVLATAHTSAKPTALRGPLLPPNVRAADFTLTDSGGRTARMASLRGHVVIMAFVHSRCRGICPFVVEGVKGALNNLPHNSAVFLAVSVAPAEDTVASRNRFLAKHELMGRMRYLNGPRSAMRKLWSAYAIAPETHHEDHSAFVYVIDRAGYIRLGYPASQLVPEDLTHDLRALGA